MRRLGSSAIWLALLVAGVAVYLTTDAPEMRHTSTLNSVFDTRWMIAGARLLALAAIVYVLASIAVRARRGQWVRSAGPVDTDAPTQAIADSQKDLQVQLRAADAVIADLETQLVQARRTIQALSASVDDRRAAGQGSREGEGTEVTDDTDS